MERDIIYVAGGLYGAPAAFDLVNAGNGDDRPYLTKDPKGLQLTRHHADLCALSPDLSTAILADYRGNPCRAGKVALTAEQRERIRRSLETNYFFD